MIDIPELLPCPFCGPQRISVLRPVLYEIFDTKHNCAESFRISCDLCKVQIHDENASDVVAIWNTRRDTAQPDEPTHDPDFRYPRPEPIDLGEDA